MALSFCFRIFTLIVGCIVCFYLTSASAKVEPGSIDIQPNYKIIEHKGFLSLHCKYSSDKSDSSQKLEWKWYKNDKLIESGSETSAKIGENYLNITKATDNDCGNYTCSTVVNNVTQKFDFDVISKPYVTIPPSHSFVEGEKLSISCKVLGVPTPNIYWIIGNLTYNQSTDRVIVKELDGTAAVLEINEITMEDKGFYTCGAWNLASKKFNNSEVTTQVRVKDKLAALWPFLGIVAEVVILCTIILIYEKKRNKTELDESDTDGSPEQKNTPDHGKDSDIRQRK